MLEQQEGEEEEEEEEDSDLMNRLRAAMMADDTSIPSPSPPTTPPPPESPVVRTHIIIHAFILFTRTSIFCPYNVILLCFIFCIAERSEDKNES